MRHLYCYLILQVCQTLKPLREYVSIKNLFTFDLAKFLIYFLLLKYTKNCPGKNLLLLKEKFKNTYGNRKVRMVISITNLILK